jgi:hypothetical protein
MSEPWHHYPSQASRHSENISTLGGEAQTVSLGGEQQEEAGAGVADHHQQQGQLPPDCAIRR